MTAFKSYRAAGSSTLDDSNGMGEGERVK